VATNPQTLNPYAYVTNNPTNLTDPSGEFAPLLALALVPVAAVPLAVLVVGGAVVVAGVVIALNTPEGLAVRAQIDECAAAAVEDVLTRTDPDETRYHHIASDKNLLYTPLFAMIFAKAGMNLKTDPDNIMPMSTEFHYSSHPPGYHEYVLRKLLRDTAGREGTDYEQALRGALRDLREELTHKPQMVTWGYWR
jgi:hypothetical protein